MVNNNKRKIIHVLCISSPYGGNIIPSLIGLARYLDKLGIEMSFVFPYAAENKEWCKDIQKEYTVYFIPQKQFSIKTVSLLKKIFDKEKPIIIHTHHDYYDIPVTIAAPMSSKVIWHYHNSTVFLSKKISRIIKRKVHYGFISKRAWLISVSDYYRNIVVKKGFPSYKTKTILNGIDFDRLNKDNEIQEVRNKNTLILLAFGYKPEIKGTDILLSACEILEKKQLDFELWLIFSESEGNLYLNQKYKGFLPKWLKVKPPTNNIREYYYSASIFISASRYETFSYSVAEATYCGLPVISSDIPGLEWSHELPSVYFFESEDIEGLVNKIYLIVESDPKQIRTHVNNSNEIIRNRYSVDEWVKNVTAYYKQFLK
ncbi:glycosyltransferase involved in cell wall biosynthesis [Bacillus fengqiuensis]|nr:glycosyltransferase involved in cell wall biosynthesis [Bacillus fengqiuensis]